jgi:hypothetical protein
LRTGTLPIKNFFMILDEIRKAGLSNGFLFRRRRLKGVEKASSCSCLSRLGLHALLLTAKMVEWTNRTVSPIDFPCPPFPILQDARIWRNLPPIAGYRTPSQSNRTPCRRGVPRKNRRRGVCPETKAASSQEENFSAVRRRQKTASGNPRETAESAVVRSPSCR